MAQTEDTELRDLVIEALEKNGSLAKIRAQLRANVFLAFEEDSAKTKHNTALDQLLNLPEGVLSLCIVHEFLEFLNLKNTLFVYTSETNQGKTYTYDKSKLLSDEYSLKRESGKEPILISILRNLSKSNWRKFHQRDGALANGSRNIKDEQNCTYIVHEDTSTSSSQSNSHSEQSSDEKTRLHLRLPLDNSDTDTSSDSHRDKTSSEYIANENILAHDESEDDKKNSLLQHSTSSDDQKNDMANETIQSEHNLEHFNFTEYQLSVLAANNSSDSIPYDEMKPFNAQQVQTLNTTGLPTANDPQVQTEPSKPRNASDSSPTLSSVASIQSLSSSEKESVHTDASEYSYDFTMSPRNKQKEKSDTTGDSKVTTIESPHQISHSSQSSVSISDVADLVEVSEIASPTKLSLDLKNSSNASPSPREFRNKERSDESGDFTDSPIPSVNISLDLHSD